MTQKEIKDKIADWENRLKNPSVAGVPSAVTKINSEIAKLEAMLEEEENIVTDKATIQKIKNSINEGELILKSGKSNGRKMSKGELEAVLNSVNKGRAKIGMPEFEKPKAEKKEKVAKEPKKEDLESVRIIANEMAIKAGFRNAKVDDLGNNEYLIEINPATEENNMAGMVLNKYKDDTYEVAEMQAGKDGNFINVFGEYKSLKPALTQLLKGNKEKPKKVIDMRSKSEHEKHESKETKSEEKAEHKKADYNCDDLIKEAKERHAKAKAAAEARANAPKKSEATKDKEKIEKVHETVEKQLEKGKLTKAQLQKLIAETKDLLKLLEKALKNL